MVFKLSLEPILVPNSFSELLICICAVPMFTGKFSLTDNKT